MRPIATTVAYDAVGNVVSRTSPRGGVATAVYDVMDRVVSETNAEGETTSSGYDGQGNVVSRTDPVGVVTEFAYDGRDLLVSTVENAVAGAPGSADTNVTTVTAYDLRGVATSVTDPRGNTTEYELDRLRHGANAADSSRPSPVAASVSVRTTPPA